MKFGPEAFLEPFEYLDTEENAAIIDKYTDFIKDTGSNQFEGLKVLSLCLSGVYIVVAK